MGMSFLKELLVRDYYETEVPRKTWLDVPAPLPLPPAAEPELLPAHHGAG